MSTKRKGLSLITLKEALPGYLWYSGVLVQFAIVLVGLQTIAGFIDRRPTHRLAKVLAEKLSESKNCTSMFRGQEFAWLDPQPVIAEDMATRGAELVKLTYRNQGSIGLSPEGFHMYRVGFEASIKDLNSGETVVFPPIAEQIMHVNIDNRIVICTPEPSYLSRTASPQVQEVVEKACESTGWKRRYLCDRGTERCYPMAQCERTGGS